MAGHEIKLEFSYTEAEYLSAARLLIWRTPSVLIRLTVFMGLLLFSMIVLAVILAEFPLWAALAVAGLVEASLLYTTFVKAPRDYFRKDQKFHDRYECTFSDERVAIKTSEIDSKLAWSLYTRVIEGSKLFILVYGTDLRMMTVVPKRAFANQDQEDEFRDLLARNVRAG